MEIIETDRAYAAGIMDGEGTFGVRKRKNTKGKQYIDFYVSVSATDECMIEWLHSRWPGSRDFRERQAPNARPLYRWVIFAKKAEGFVRDVESYMVVKRPQAAVFLRMRDLTGAGYRVPEDNQAERTLLIAEMRRLNKRGLA